ncbi:ABC transporter substrate-binding protein [Falsiroseomonas sp. HC035]|uniref:ABC transporter substrate-binding protein n=1 Tax=Falsiroseomonas sp. HC035 TaxID=3390999 RepID=UPI003D316337
MSTSRLTRRGVMAAGAATLGGFALSRPALAQARPMRIGGTPNYGPVLPVIAAERLGLFAKAGVAVEFTGYAGGSASMEGMAAGEADLINFFPPGAALARARGVRSTIVSAGTLTPRGWKVMVAKSSPVTEMRQLAGKKIGITANGSTTDFFALWVGQQAGGTVARIPLGGGGLIPSLIAGNVDAIVAYPPLSYQLESSGDGRVLVDLGTAMQPNLPDVWIASEKVVAERPDDVRRALVGLYSAIRHMKRNPEWAIRFIQDQNRFTPEIARLEFENTIMGLSDDGELREEWVEASLGLGRLAGLQNLPAAKDMFTTRFVPVTPIDA